MDQNLEKLNENIEKNNSLVERLLKINRWYYVIGRGVLAALGSTIIFALMIWLIFYILKRFEYLPYIQNFIENLNLLLNRKSF